MCIPVQKNVSVQKNIFSKIWKKSVGTLYMIITMYLNIYAYYSVPKQNLCISLLQIISTIQH